MLSPDRLPDRRPGRLPLPSPRRRPDWHGAASALGRSLCAAAYWDEARQECNWIGHRDIEDALTAPYSDRNAALSPELYSGSSGVAWFLAELHGETGLPVALATARAALRRSIRYSRDFPSPAYPLSLYAGTLGLLHVAARLAAIAPDPALDEECARLFDQAREGWRRPHPYDIIGGNAGAILALLDLAESFRAEECRSLAHQLGEELCETASWAGDACTWRATGGFAELPPMTGFSHGVSGIAVSLLRLYELTGEARFLRTARGAFAFEDSLYNPMEKNWIDTRYPYEGQGSSLTGRFRLSWCHGAPGIALARALASRLDTERAETHARLAQAAAETTLTALTEKLQQPGHDATLCHGLAGFSEILLVLSEILDEDPYRERAERAFAKLLPRLGAWSDCPSGLICQGRTPCLMVGAAGIGLHLLRLGSPRRVPSPLLPGWR
jgi:lantibiotic modifying enzyme